MEDFKPKKIAQKLDDIIGEKVVDVIEDSTNYSDPVIIITEESILYLNPYSSMNSDGAGIEVKWKLSDGERAKYGATTREEYEAIKLLESKGYKVEVKRH